MPADLQDFDLFKDGCGTLDEETAKQVYKKLKAWTRELGDALGIEKFNPKAPLPKRAAYGSKRQLEVLRCIQSRDEPQTPAIVANKVDISVKRARTYLSNLTLQKKIENPSPDVYCRLPSKVVVL